MATFYCAFYFHTWLVASDPKIEGYGNISNMLPMSSSGPVASDPKIEGYGNMVCLDPFQAGI